MKKTHLITLQIIRECQVSSYRKKNTRLECACLWGNISFDKVINVCLQVSSDGGTVPRSAFAHCQLENLLRKYLWEALTRTLRKMHTRKVIVVLKSLFKEGKEYKNKQILLNYWTIYTYSISIQQNEYKPCPRPCGYFKTVARPRRRIFYILISRPHWKNKQTGVKQSAFFVFDWQPLAVSLLGNGSSCQLWMWNKEAL